MNRRYANQPLFPVTDWPVEANLPVKTVGMEDIALNYILLFRQRVYRVLQCHAKRESAC